MVGILLNQACRPFAAPARRRADGGDEPAVPEYAFQGWNGRRPGWWVLPPARPEAPGERLEAEALRREPTAAIAALPPRQREVITMRDVVGRPAEEFVACWA